MDEDSHGRRAYAALGDGKNVGLRGGLAAVVVPGVDAILSR